MIIPQEIKLALNILNNSGNSAYIVGGAVRNYLLNSKINDYDITTSATPNTIKILFSDYNQYVTGEKHGTVVVLIGKYKIDITTFRKDGEYIDNRHPRSVEYTNDLFEDLKRRDFTINAMCIDINNNLIDLFDGSKDLDNKIIRAIGKPDNRFKEDALRILRAIKFASRLNFTIEDKTRDAIFNNKDLLKNIAMERKKDEFLSILSSSNKAKYINEYLDVFNTFIPIVKVDNTINNFLDPYYSLAYLLKDLKKINLKDFKYSKHEINLINALIEASRINISNDYDFISCLSNMYEIEILNYLSQLYNLDLSNRYSTLKPYICDINSLKITGEELMKYGYKDKAIKEIKLKIIEEIKNQRLLNTNETIKEYLSRGI